MLLRIHAVLRKIFHELKWKAAWQSTWGSRINRRGWISFKSGGRNPVSLIDLIKQEGDLAILMHVSQKGCHVVSSKMMSQLKLVHRKFTVFRLFLAPSCCDYHVALSCCSCKIGDVAIRHKIEFDKLFTLTCHNHRNFVSFLLKLRETLENKVFFIFFFERPSCRSQCSEHIGWSIFGFPSDVKLHEIKN